MDERVGGPPCFGTPSDLKKKSFLSTVVIRRQVISMYFFVYRLIILKTGKKIKNPKMLDNSPSPLPAENR